MKGYWIISNRFAASIQISLGQEDPLEKGMAIHSSILAWKIPWTEDPGGLQSIGSQRVRNDWVTKTFTFHYSDGNVRFCPLLSHIGLPRCLSGKEFTHQRRRCGFNPWAKKIPWRRKWLLTLAVLPRKIPLTEEPGGLPWDHKESYTTEHTARTHTHTHTHTHYTDFQM